MPMYLYPFEDVVEVQSLGKRRVEGFMESLPLSSDKLLTVFYTNKGSLVGVNVKDYNGN